MDRSAEGIVTLTIAVLTYKRNADLAALLPGLVGQITSISERGVTARVLVIDNDPAAGARPLVESSGEAVVTYVHEAVPGISAARNRALEESATSDVLVFIDDDERPTDMWLASLLSTYWSAGSPAAVIGPVISQFSVEPDAWVAAGEFFRRRRMPTGTALTVGATNNLLLDLTQIRAYGLTFDVGSGTSGGEDTLFTKQVVAAGGRMIWCDEAIVNDIVPPDRLTRTWVLSRALSSGNSWSITTLDVQAGTTARTAARFVLTGRGVVRVVGGISRWLLGTVTRSTRHRAKGLRTAARGLGMTTGAWGHRYEEYRRAS